MENVKCFFRNLLIIIALFIPSLVVIVAKALEWMAKRICACVRRVLQFFNANTSAMPRTEPTITVRICGNSTASVTSGNIESRQVKTTNQNMKNKKPYREKKKIKTNEEAHNYRLLVPVNFSRQVRVDGRISSKDNFHRTEKVVPRTTRSLWGQYSDVKNRKTSNYNQERINADRIKTPLKQQVVRKDLFHKTDRKFASSLNSATCTPRRLYSNVLNTNVSQEVRNHHEQLNHILKMKPQEKVASAAQHPVRLWSVDFDAEAITSASDHQRQADCCETNENNVPESTTEELEEIIANSSESETSAISNTFPCNRVLMIVANAMVLFVLGAMQPICSELKSQLANIERNQRIKHCSFILMAVANAMVVFVLSSMKPVCSYVKAQLANIEIRERIKQCCRILMAVANAVMSVVLGAMQSLFENRKVIKDVIVRILWRAVRVLYAVIVSAVTTLKSTVVCWSRTDRPSKRKITSHEISNASPLNTGTNLKRDTAAGVQDTHQEVSSTKTVVADQSCITYPSSVKTEGIYPTSQHGRYSQLSDVLQNPTNKNDKQPASQRTDVNLHAQTTKSQRRKNGQQESHPLKERVQSNASATVGHAHLARPSEGQVKVSTKGKVKEKNELSSVLLSNVDEPTRATVSRKRKQKKVATAASVDLLVTTASVASKSNGKPIPKFTPPSYVNMVARAKAHIQEIRSPRVGLSNLLMPAKVSEESETSSPRNSDNTSSCEIQEVIKRTVSRAKRRNTESETTSTNVQASEAFVSQCGYNVAVPRPSTEVRENSFELTNKLNATAYVGRPRENIKRKADDDTGSRFEYEPNVLDPARRIAHLATQKSHDSAVEQPELMEVGEGVDKPFSIACPEEVHVCEEPSAANTILTAEAESSASFNAELETKEMETVEEQASVWNFFSFSLPSFLAAPFKFQSPEEEMEVDEQTVSVTTSNSEEVEMESNEQPFAMAATFGQQENHKWNALAAAMGRSITASTLSQQEAMEISLSDQLQVDRETASPFRELVDAKRPLAPTVGMFGGTALPVKEMPAVQHPGMPSVMQPVTQPAIRPVTQPAIRPVSQSVKQPSLHLWTQPVIQQATQPAMQSVIQPVVQPAMQQMMQSEMQRPLMQPATQPNVEPLKVPLPAKPIIDHSTLLEYNTAVVCGLTNETSEGEPSVREFTATGQSLTSEVIKQEATLKSKDQLIMEQLQLVPPTDPACYLADRSDSDSEDDSDDEYELDLKTIENFSVLEKCPDHDQLITKLLIKKEATEWHRNVANDANSDSESDSEDTDTCSELEDVTLGEFVRELKGLQN